MPIDAVQQNIRPLERVVQIPQVFFLSRAKGVLTKRHLLKALDKNSVTPVGTN